jgi:protein associated with RNAse G/E
MKFIEEVMRVVFDAAQECGILSEDDTTVTDKKDHMTHSGVIEVVRFQPIYAFNLQAILCEEGPAAVYTDSRIQEYR